jgi:hypothetical protein
MIAVAMWNMHPLPTIFYAVTLLDLSALLCISTSVAMATLPKRVVKLEEVVLGFVVNYWGIGDSSAAPGSLLLGIRGCRAVAAAPRQVGRGHRLHRRGRG